MTKTMAEVLATHRLDVTMYIGVGQEHLCICGNRSEDHDAHQAGELVAEGYGHVREAGAKALEDAAGVFGQYAKNAYNNNPNLDREIDALADGWKRASTKLRARAAAVRGAPMSRSVPMDYEALREARAQEADRIGPDRNCGWRVGPVWKLDGETCVCKLTAPHPMPHECTCGSWFEDCGHGPDQERNDNDERNDHA